MDMNRYTEKAQQAVVQAQNLAAEFSHGQIESEHLLLALLRQSDGVVPLIVQGLGLQADHLAQQIESELAGRSQVYGGTTQVSLSRELSRTLQRAETLAKEMRDDFVSTEHVLLALDRGSRRQLSSALAGLWSHQGRHPAGADRHPRQPAGHFADT